MGKMTKKTQKNREITHFSSLSTVRMVGKDLGVFIHNAEDPEDVIQDLLDITLQPLNDRDLLAANAA